MLVGACRLACEQNGRKPVPKDTGMRSSGARRFAGMGKNRCDRFRDLLVAWKDDPSIHGSSHSAALLDHLPAQSTYGRVLLGTHKVNEDSYIDT